MSEYNYGPLEHELAGGTFIYEYCPTCNAQLTDADLEAGHCTQCGTCKHGNQGYCFACIREKHEQDMLDGAFENWDSV